MNEAGPLSADIIPINRSIIRTLEKILETIGDCRQKPKDVDAIFIDNKSFMRVEKVGFPAPKYFRFASYPKSPICTYETATDSIVKINYTEFFLYRKIGNTYEYREV